jgi:hypothetical protein
MSRNNHNFYKWIPANQFHYVTGTWAMHAGQVAGTIVHRKTAAAETSVISIPIALPSNAKGSAGSLIKSISVDFEITVAALTTLTAVLNKITRGADGAVATVTAITTWDYDTGHDAAAERVDVDQHRMTITPNSPTSNPGIWIDDEDEYVLQITAVCAGTSVLEFLGAVVKYWDVG